MRLRRLWCTLIGLCFDLYLSDGGNPAPSSTSLTQPPGISPLEAVDAENDTETPEGDGTVIEVSEDCQGSYCPIDRQHGQKRRKLNARASKGILYGTGKSEMPTVYS